MADYVANNGSDTGPPPPWLVAALAHEPEVEIVQVEGSRIATLAWGERSSPTLTLVHGGAAHARWWCAVAPLLARDFRVVALDLSGHGDSGWRDLYRTETWAEEVLAAAAAAGGTGHPLVVGHSMGGLVTVALAAKYGAQLAGAVLLDAPVRRPDPESEEGRGGRMFRSPKTYPDLRTAMAHFHLVPPQPCDNPWLLEFVARTSLRPVTDGWTWKFDPQVFSAREGATAPSDFGSQLSRAGCRLAIVNGERSKVVDDRVRADMVDLLASAPAARAGVPVIEVPEAHHHLLLEQPIALVTALRGVLAAWRPIGQPPTEVEADH